MGTAVAPAWRRQVCNGAKRPFPLNSASRASGSALCVAMRPLQSVFIYFTVTVVLVGAKIHGGPRGRFSNNSALRAANSNHVVTRHTHYSYHPPTFISFMCRHCSAPVTYPVFHGQPPTYIYKYRESVGRYGMLLSGLALYNLGRSTGNSLYHVQNAEDKCSMQIISLRHYEETSFPCFMMSTFMERTLKINHDDPNVFDITSAQIDVKPFINNTGLPLAVNGHQDCVIWHNATMLQERKSIPCALLKEYAETMKPSGIPVYIWLPMTLAIVLTLYICCQCICRRRREKTEAMPINQSSVVIGYCSH
ncbi:hypothetical protein MSG28_003279 [Choristoneura fumiferana]|uniref:Uncharacterized protein n=1 Tax=Choristoneura fumiferana TaxID=7141 RepID=A0ACC0KE80_CHOFU|nr:hypothetical protein MSG28_003279 [Choristoneura fumiferana]